MTKYRELKAEPSEEETQTWAHEQDNSRWRGQRAAWIKAAIALVVLALGWTTFVHICGNGERFARYWNSDRWQHGGSKGSQYLLGVGKADITGCVSLSSCNWKKC